MVDNARAGVGDTITVRAVLSDEQFEPLRVASVDTNLLKPDGSIEVVVTDNSNVTEEKYVLGRTGKEVKDFLSGEFESEE